MSIAIIIQKIILNIIKKNPVNYDYFYNLKKTKKIISFEKDFILEQIPSILMILR